WIAWTIFIDGPERLGKRAREQKRKEKIRMKAKVEIILTVALLSALTVFPIVFAQDTVVGVNPGDWVRYKVTRLGSSFAWVEDAVWIEVEVLNVSDTTVTIGETVHDADGSELVRNFSSDLLSSPAYYFYIIAANLGSGDKVDTFPMWNETKLAYVDITLNDTDYRSYGGVTREVNRLKYSYVKSFFSDMANFTIEEYWDRSTGFLLEKTYQFYLIDRKLNLWSMYTLKIEDTNMWEMEKPPQSFLWLAAIPIGAVIVAAVAVKLRNDKKKNEEDKQ
ncbi:hypothetical protein KAU92_05225, partial [Candidatus Bathyarchaeota archaeon]|nr:hypothetical protein [Candidatus Bathyarchaeota archaeon]